MLSKPNTKLSELVLNIFCATGIGGGIKPNCKGSNVAYSHSDAGGGSPPANPFPGVSPARIAKMTAEAKLRNQASTDSRSKKALALTNKADSPDTHKKAGEAHRKAMDFHSLMGHLEIASAHNFFVNYHAKKSHEG